MSTEPLYYMPNRSKIARCCVQPTIPADIVRIVGHAYPCPACGVRGDIACRHRGEA